ncbi:MAG: hypothetical protein M0R38_03740 [Bacteroidia bacterium]|nr:hypothetical protein [Bacteroidia bacterium]
MQVFSSKNEKEDKVKAGFFTGIMTLLLILLLIFAGFRNALNEDSEEGGGGVEVQMGDPNHGGPDNSPASERVVPVQPQQIEPDDNFTTNQNDGVTLNNKKDKPRQTQTTPQTQEQPKQPEPQISNDLDNLFKSSKDSKGQGNGQNTGTQGNPDGKGNSPTGGSGGGGDGVGSGSGSGTGDGFKLGQGFGNRRISFAPTIRSACTNAKGGRVVFKVEVAPNGTVVNVLNPTTGERGTNVSDPCLMAEAVALVKKVKLSSSNENMNTIGEITITIKN